MLASQAYDVIQIQSKNSQEHVTLTKYNQFACLKVNIQCIVRSVYEY